MNNYRSKRKKEFLKTHEYICVICGNKGEYNGFPLSLELDHIDGNRYNDDENNLRLLCPNCHSQQITSNRRNKYTVRKIVDINMQEFEKVVLNSKNLREVCNKLGISDSGANYAHLKIVIKNRSLNAAHLWPRDFKIKINGLRRQYINWNHKTKIKWPTIEEITKLIWEKPTVILSKELGVSDTAIAKFCKKHNINKPPRGYWEKIHHRK